MRLKDIRGKYVNKNVFKYRIDWDAPSCSKPQFIVKQFLKSYWDNFVCYEEFPVFGSRMRVDILNATSKIAIEVNGEQHDTFNKHFHNKSRYLYWRSIVRDEKKREWLESNDFKLIEIKEREVNLLSEKFFKDRFNLKL